VTGELFVIDGQHRLAAARLRRDIPHLPCVILDLADRADEAANFVHLNQRRRPLSKLNVFKAALASGDTEASDITAALAEAGLSIASGTNPDWWKPGQLVNIGGLQTAYRRHGKEALRAALLVFADAFRGQVLRYAGTIFPGVMALVAELTKETEPRAWMNDETAVMLVEMLGETPQDEWRGAIMLAAAAGTSFSVAEAAVQVIADAWRELQEALVGEDEDDSEAQAFDRARHELANAGG
jgi:hypothetical protein